MSNAISRSRMATLTKFPSFLSSTHEPIAPQTLPYVGDTSHPQIAALTTNHIPPGPPPLAPFLESLSAEIEMNEKRGSATPRVAFLGEWISWATSHEMR